MKNCSTIYGNSMGPKPKVSVLMITYNQQKFIAQAVESVLEQTTDFDYEIVIGDDCSSDRTRNILLSYTEKHPNVIRLRLNSSNVGANRNFVQTLEVCRGTYIAILEGDDYWIDPFKLRRQVEFLDANMDCAICFHSAKSVDENGVSINEHKVSAPPRAKSTIEDLLRNGNFIHTPSVMFRSGLIGDFPDWFYSSKLGDWPLHVLNAQHGDIGYLNETMAAYRVHSESMWSATSQIFRLEETLKTLEMMNAHLQFEYAGIVNNSIARLLFEMAIVNFKSGQWASAFRHTCKAMVRSPFTTFRLLKRSI